MEIADRYTNDSDIICKFTYNFDVPPMTSTTSDRIGFYRVPYFNPHEYLAFQWVSDAIKDNNNFMVTFKASDLPKDEDFYQFQFLRTENGVEDVIGASVPFQLQTPKNEELCTVEDDEEFMVVRSRTSLVTEQMSTLSVNNTNLKEKVSELENKYKKLLDLSEKLQEDLEKKSVAYLSAEEELEKTRAELKKLGPLKGDLACVLQDKHVLEEKLHRVEKALATIKMDRDLLTGERDQANREKDLLKEERNQIVAKNEELKSMFNAATTAKDLTAAEVKKCILKSDEQKATIQAQAERIAKLDELNKDLLEVNGNQNKMISSLQERMTEFEALKEEHEALKRKFNGREKEVEIMKQELYGSKTTKFREIDSLKKQLTEAERNLNKVADGAAMSANGGSDSSEVSLSSLHSKVLNIERTVKQTQEEMRQLLGGKSSESSSNFDLESCTSVDTNDSRRLLESQVIHNALNEPDAEVETTSGNKELEKLGKMASPLKKRFGEVMEGFRELEDAPQNHGARPKMSASTPEPQATFDNEEQPVGSLFKLLPQISQSVFGLLPASSSEEPEQDGTKPSAPIEEQPRSNEESDQFSDLVNWAKGNIVSSISSANGVVLTDDGRTMTEEEAHQPNCPICGEDFKRDEVKALELHIDAHLASSLYCPICNIAFDVSKRDQYQQHVEVTTIFLSSSFTVYNLTFTFRVTLQRTKNPETRLGPLWILIEHYSTKRRNTIFSFTYFCVSVMKIKKLLSAIDTHV